MLARVTTFAVDGIDPRRVTVEVDLRAGLPSFTIVGLADRAVREARERVQSAILNSGFAFPGNRVTVNLAPASLRKAGPHFDLAIAVGILAAAGEVPLEPLVRTAVFGELSLGGEVRPCRGALSVAEGAVRGGLDALVVPVDRVQEAGLVGGLGIAGATSLREVVAVLRGEHAGTAPSPRATDDGEQQATLHDLADVRGHADALAALTIAAAGGHNLLLSGPPGIGKTMLARRLPTILPPLTRQEALEVTRIHSIAGEHRAGGLVTHRPFRAPHHAISVSALVGGGAMPRPGQVSLAHHGVLFLDELSEFPRATLEALRQPLEDGRVSVVRGQRTAIFPARFMLVAATNPCPCGHAPTRRCQCSETDLARHRRRLSGPLLDRVDLLVHLQRPAAADLARAPASSSAHERERVLQARERQHARLAGTGCFTNAQMDARLVRELIDLAPGADRPLRLAYENGVLSARGRDRALRVARTIADLEGSARVRRGHVVTALGFRQDPEAAQAA